MWRKVYSGVYSALHQDLRGRANRRFARDIGGLDEAKGLQQAQLARFCGSLGAVAHV
jgi:hypothetical protein